MSDITIPPEALDAAATAIFDASPFREKEGPLHMQSDAYQALTRAYARAACLALFDAWPGMHKTNPGRKGQLFGVYEYSLILPLTENQNDQG